MRYGYVRVSTQGQESDLQVRALRSAGVRRIVVEVKSGAGDRPKLEALLRGLGVGDELIVYKVDRVARSLRDLLRVLAHVGDAGGTFRSLTEPIETGTASGRLLVQLLGAFAEFERSMIRERCAAGRVAAVARGVRFGRPVRFSDSECVSLAVRRSKGVSQGQLAREFGCDLSTIRRAVLRGKKIAPCGASDGGGCLVSPCA